VRKLLFLLLLLSPGVSLAWWSNDWNYRKEIDFDLSTTGANIGGTPLDVPVLIRLSLANFGYFNDVKSDGGDFRFVDSDDKTPLKFHIERFDATNQIAFIWVRVPTLPAGAKTGKIYMYYGNPKAPTGGDAAATYDANQTLVVHFADPAQPIVDATAFANHPSASTAQLTAASLIAGGAKFSGGQAITFPAASALRLLPAKGGTLSAWVRIDAPQTDAYLLALQDGAKEWIVGIRGTQAYTRIAGGGGAGGGRTELVQSGSLTSGQWHHIAASLGSGGKLTLYVDGESAATAQATATEIAGTLTIGAGAEGGHNLSGEVDEVQSSSVERSVDWVRAAAKSQGQESPLVAYGGDAQREAQKVSYFQVTLQNVTIDGWVVIGILFVMLLIALLVMVSKAFYLSRVQSANTQFLSKYESLASMDESSALPEEEFRHSTLWRLYHRGLQEMTGRIAGHTASAQRVLPVTLSPQAIDAIKATMDASLVRLTQRMSSNMVLLTIAIAGGPFLGLLGTVVGVMITFAAIAASGDVNVNAIAPGIAAALVATVAGLGVAIPSLFGYNWLNTRIKHNNASMRVFVDEFVARVAEQYS
jgi:biopolymer transport protein ExbB